MSILEDEAKCCRCNGSCQATARKRRHQFPEDWTGNRHEIFDYLCAPCCTRQDEAKNSLTMAVWSLNHLQLPFLLDPNMWLDEILEALDSATGKAKEAL